MALFRTLRMFFWLSAVPALIAVSGASPRLVPGRPANGDRLADAAPTPRLQNFGRIPLSFEANQGQTDRQVQYLARGPGYTVFLTATEAVLALNRAGQVGDSAPAPISFRSKKGTANSTVSPPEERGAPGERAVVRMQLLGSNPAAVAQGTDLLPGIVNYFLGNDASKWRTGIPTYARVHYPEVYPGISLVYYGNQRQLEYDFQVSPGADPSQIRLRFSGAERLTVDERGDLVVKAGRQVLLHHKPVVYQAGAGARREVAANFLVQGQEMGFALGGYDRSRPLVIDPVLSYSTFLGGSDGDIGQAIAVDGDGNAYVTGLLLSTDFPTANPFQPTYGGGLFDAFVAKFSADGASLVYSTYLGGSGGNGDLGFGIAVDAAGNAYVTGRTASPDFPSANAFQPTYGGGPFDAFVTKLSADGASLVYSTYLGGGGDDEGYGIAVDGNGNAYVTGWTSSRNFPTANAFQPTYGRGISDAFVTKLVGDGASLVYSTYLGGSSNDTTERIAVDGAGNAYVTGTTSSTNFPTANAFQPTSGGLGDAFVTKLSADGASLVYSTYLGGSGYDLGLGIAVDAAGNTYVAGRTASPDFPTANPLQPTYGGGDYDAFVTVFSADGASLVYSTYLGGSGDDESYGIAVDAAGNAYVTGQTSSPDFPTANALQPTYGGGSLNAFVTKLSADGASLVYSSYLGGSGRDAGQGIAVDAAGNAYVTGQASPDFPTANAFQPTSGGGSDAFVTKISP